MLDLVVNPMLVFSSEGSFLSIADLCTGIVVAMSTFIHSRQRDDLVIKCNTSI